jgi:hypothetical protein
LTAGSTLPVVAIHQPNFFPWLGYFDKIARADTFVFLDAADYPKNSWVNRVKLSIQGEARWVTCPIRRVTAGGPIAEVLVDDDKPWRVKLLKTLEANYGTAPRYRKVMDTLEPLIESGHANLAAFNITAIAAIAQELGVNTRMLRQSDLRVSGQSNDLLVSIVKAAGGGAYLIGGGAGGYHDDTVFAAGGVAIVRQDFQPREYGPPGRFLPGLSVIDYLMYDGRPVGVAPSAGAL